jgi:hypothetical protein
VGRFERKVLRMFGFKRHVVKDERKKLQNDEINNLYSSPSTVMIIKSWMRYMGERRNVFKIFLEKSLQTT